MKSYMLPILMGIIFSQFVLCESSFTAQHNKAGVMLLLKRLEVTLPDERDQNETTI